jgi:hypothetical protein
MLRQPVIRSLLDLDPDLGRLLGPERSRQAQRDLEVPLLQSNPGVWRPEAWLSPAPGAPGLLIVSGVVVRAFSVHGSTSAELLGDGDLIRTWADQDLGEVDSPRWSALTPISVARLDTSLAVRLSRYPEVMMLLLERVDARARRLATAQAISQLTGVDLRLQSLFEQLAGRWGKVSRDGVVIPLSLSHRLLGSLVGARRPTVSTALALLSVEQRLVRRPDGTWLMPHKTSEPVERREFAVAAA